LFSILYLFNSLLDGGNVTRQPGPVLGGTTEIAFVEAPEGFKVWFGLVWFGLVWLVV
jgi:hypothetical protein